MAKTPTQDRYRIHGETSLIEFGPLLAVLTKMGLTNIGYELISDVHTYKDKKKHEVKAIEFAMEFISEHATFRIKDLIKHFEDNNRLSGSANRVVRILLEKKVLKKLGPGNYQRADVVKASPKPDKTQKVHKTRKPNIIPRYEVGNLEFIMKYIKPRKQFTVGALNKHFDDAGRNSKSVSPILTRLRSEKVVKLVAQGVWEVTKKGKAVKVTTTRKSPALNGAGVVDDVVAPEVTTNA